MATTSGGVAATLGYEDHEGAPAEEMLAAAGRIARSVDIPVTVDAEAGYGMEPAKLVAALKGIEVAGCNLEDTDHATGMLRDPAPHADWLGAVREAARSEGYPLVVNARIDVFLAAFHAGSGQSQQDLVPEALDRAHAYLDAGVDCVYPIALWEEGALAGFVAGAEAPSTRSASRRPRPSTGWPSSAWRASATGPSCIGPRWRGSRKRSHPLRPTLREGPPQVCTAS